MKMLKTLRVRFALWLTLLILAFLAIFSFGVHFSLSRSLYTGVDETLVLSAEQIIPSLQEEDGSILMPPLDANAPDLIEFDPITQRGITIVILSQNGYILQAAGTHSLFSLSDSLPPTQPEFQTIPEAAEIDRIRVYSLPIVENDQILGWVQSMQSLGTTEESLDKLRTLLVTGSAILSLLAGFAGYFLATRALAPIDKITNTAHRISIEDLSARLNLPDTGDEVSRLANTFDEMLERIESGFTRERQFTADASHELRTPLTAMQTILQFTREGERSLPEYRLALDDLAEEADRLQALVEDLLHLARGEGGLELYKEEIDLSLLLDDVADSLRALAEKKGFALKTNLPPSLIIFGDTDQLIRLIVNLLDNAIKYTQEGSVNISAHNEEDHSIIEVADTGIGIQTEHLPHIFERFYRVEASRSSQGVGLGLSIAEQIVLAHGGKLRVTSVSGKGTKFTVFLPNPPE